MKKYAVYYRYKPSFEPDIMYVDAYNISDAICEALYTLNDHHKLIPELVDICHIEEVED